MKMITKGEKRAIRLAKKRVIWEEHLAGYSTSDLAKKYHVTERRMGQIFQEAKNESANNQNQS